MKKITNRLMLLLIVSIFSINTQAQVRELQGSGEGRGVLKFAGQRDRDLTGADIVLKRDGNMEIRLLGDESYTFTGRWSAGRVNTYELDVTGGFGNLGATGKGRVTVRQNGQIVRLEFNGYTRRQTYSVTFDGDQVNNNDSQYDRSGDYIGVYRSVETTQKYNQDFTIVRVLRIKDNGIAEVVSRFKGGEPVVNRENLRIHGELLSQIRSRKTVLHRGTWRKRGRSIEVVLDNLNNNETMQATFQFEFRGGDKENLQTTNWDRTIYGSSAFKFQRVLNEDDNDGQPGSPDNDEINLSNEGEGRLSIGRESDRNINRVSVVRSTYDNVEISLSLSNGNTIKFNGRVSNRDRRAMTVLLTNSGNANASGEITIETGVGRLIERLTGNGRLDGRNFTVDFNGRNFGYDPNANDRERINLSQRGSGLWKREGRSNANIENATVVSTVNREVEISLRLSNGQRITLNGRLESRNAYELIINLTNSTDGNASGTINVEYGANNSIRSLSGDGRVNGSRFSVQFSRQ
jgi:hypothetical protein